MCLKSNVVVSKLKIFNSTRVLSQVLSTYFYKVFIAPKVEQMHPILKNSKWSCIGLFHVLINVKVSSILLLLAFIVPETTLKANTLKYKTSTKNKIVYTAPPTDDYQNPGTYTFVVPDGVTSLTVETWGGGGRGGSRTSSSNAYGGGGGGAYSRQIISVTPGQTLTLNVGAGATTNTAPGGDSWVSTTTSVAQAFVLAKGGATVGNNITSGAAGGSASSGIGSIKYNGGNGANAGNTSTSGGGGSSAGSASNGNNASGMTAGAAPVNGGAGGNGRNGNGNGNSGSYPGGGGGGAVRTSGSPTGGNGGNGRIILNYEVVVSADAGPDQTQCRNAAFNLTGNNVTGFTGTWSIVSGVVNHHGSLSTPNLTVVIQAGTTATMRYTLTNGTTTTTDDVILTNTTSCAPVCTNPLNHNGDLEDEGVATNFNLTFQGTPALLIQNQINPPGWSERYGGNATNTSTFQGAYYMKKTGTAGNPFSGTHMVYMKGAGFCASVLQSETGLACGKKYNFSMMVAAYSNTSTQGSAPFKLEFFASTGGSTPIEVYPAIALRAPASTSWNNLNWQRYEFEIDLPNNGFNWADFYFTTDNNTHGIVVDDICIREVNTGSHADAGPDQRVCGNTFTMAANTPPAGYTGTWSVVTGSATIANASSPSTNVTVSQGSLNQLRWTVSGGGSAYTQLLNPNLNGGFEVGSDFTSNGWTVVNHGTNNWNVWSTPGVTHGYNAAYISNAGTTAHTYNLTTPQTSHFYRDITVPAGQTDINLSFKWKNGGENNYDRILVYTAPTTVTPVAGTPSSNSTTLSGATLVSGIGLHSSTTYQTANITLPSSLAGTTFRLIFTWQNDNSAGVNPPAAIDEISLTSSGSGPNCVTSDDVILASTSGSNIIVNNPTICVGNATSLNVSGCTGSLLWSNGATTSSITVSPATTTTYSVTCTPGESGNLIQNPGFEGSPNFTSWENWSGSSITSDLAHVRSGSKAAMLDASSSWASFGQTITVSPGESFTLSVWAKTNNTNPSPRVGMRFFNSSWAPLGPWMDQNLISTNYSQYIVSGVAPPGALYLQVIASTGSGAIMYVDDIVLTKATSCSSFATSTVTVGASNNITLSNVNVGTCINHPLEDVVPITVQVAWTSAPAGDYLRVKLNNKNELINMSGGLTSPQTVTFYMPAKGTLNHVITADWLNTPSCESSSPSFNIPGPCSSDMLNCDILYLCGNDKPYDGMAFDHGIIEYLMANNTGTIVPVLTKDNAQGFYDPITDTPITIDINSFRTIIVSPTTEGWLSANVINQLKGFSGNILNMNYLIQQDLGMTTTETYSYQNNAYYNNTQQHEIYNYDNPGSYYTPVITGGNYISQGVGGLWYAANSVNSRINGMQYNIKAHSIPNFSSTHGNRVYLGVHMNGLWASPRTGYTFPPVSADFHPAKHLTMPAKIIFDQAIKDAIICGVEICDNNIDDDGDGLIDCFDPDCGLIVNREFDQGFTGWNLYTQSGANATVTIDNTSQLSGINSARFNISSVSGTDWHIQAVQTNRSIVAGKTYKLTFRARASANRQIAAAVDLGVSPWTSYFFQNVSLTTTAQNYSYTFTASTTTSLARLVFNLGINSATVWLDNVQLTEVCAPTEVCNNGIDDDGDGLVDCDDPDCYKVIYEEFDGGLSEWVFAKDASVSGSISIDGTSQLSGPNSARVVITSTPGTAWFASLHQENMSIFEGKTYELSFIARASTNRSITVSLQQQVSPYVNFIAETVNLSTTQQTYKYYFTTTVSYLNIVKLVFHLAGSPGTVWLDGIQLKEVCTPMEICDNGIDDDGDGLIDCADPDCRYSKCFTDFNFISFGPVDVQHSDIQGKVLYCDNATVSNYSIGTSLPVGGIEPVVYVNGNFSMTNGAIQGGPIMATGSISLTNVTNQAGNGTAPAPTTIPNATNFPVSCATEEIYFTTLSNNFKAMSTNGTFSLSGSDKIFNCNNLTGTVVFNITLSPDQYIFTYGNCILQNHANASGIIINILHTSPVMHSMGMNQAFTDNSYKIIWNFPNATKLRFSALGLKGSILAPTAQLVMQNGHVDGNVIVKGFIMNDGTLDHPNGNAGEMHSCKNETICYISTYYRGALPNMNYTGCEFHYPTPPTVSSNNLCVGSTLQLYPNTGVTWVSSNPSVASVSNSGLVTALSTGNTSLTFKLNTGFCYSDPVTINVGVSPNVSISGSSAICVGNSTTFTASGGVSYLWNTNATTAAISVNTAGTYTVTVTNATGCTSTATRTLTINSNPTASITGTNTVCIGNSTTFTATGGGTYLWSAGAATTAAITVNTAGTYTVTVTNAAGCTATATRTLTINANPSPSITGTNIICTGNSTTFTASGGGTYLWSIGAATTAAVTVSTAGTYTVTVTNAAGCTATATRTLTINANPTASISGTNVICTGNSTTFTASGGGTYLWSAGAATTAAITVSTAGTYTVTVTNAAGCTATATRTLTVNANPIASISGLNLICDGASTTLTASGGTSYAWSTGGNTSSISVSPTATTTYIVTVTAANTCTATSSSTINLYPAINVTATTSTSSACIGQEIVLSGTGTQGILREYFTGISGTAVSNLTSHASYPNNPNLREIRPNTIGPNGIGDNYGTRVRYYFTPPTSNTYQFVIYGDDETILYWSGSNASSPLSIIANIPGWTNEGELTKYSSQVTVNLNLQVGQQYYFELLQKEGNGGDHYGILYRIAGEPSFSNIPSALISPSKFSWTGPAGFSSNVLNNTINNAQLNNSGTYILTATDIYGCTKTSDVNITVNNNPTPAITGTNTICAGNSTIFTASGGGTYLWSAGSATTAAITVSTAGTYTVTVTNAAGCTATATRTLSVNANPTPAISGTNTICTGNSSIFTASGGGTYLWSAGAATTASITVSTAGTYTVTVTNAAGCTATATRTLTYHPNPTPAITGTNSICDGQSTTFTASGGGTYTWNTGESTPDIVVCKSGTYTVTVTNTHGCTATSTRTLAIIELPNTNITGSDKICIGNTTTLTSSSGGTWTSNNPSIATISNGGVVTGLTAGSATFTFTSSITGCSSNASAVVNIGPSLSATIDYNGSVCITDNAQLTAIPTGGTAPFSYNWTGPSGFNGSTQTITITNNGNYYLTVSDSYGCTAITNGFVNERFDPFIVNLNTEVCEGSSVLLTANGSSIVSYLWSSNAGNATTQAVTVFPTLPASTYTVTITNNIGCTAVLNSTINVKPKPTVSVSGPTNICVGTTTQLSPSTGGTWISSNPSIASVTNSGIVMGQSEGTATFIFTSSITNCSSDETVPITVNPLPVPTFSGPTAICIATTSSIEPSTGGTWVSSDPSVATITNAGIITGVSQGTAHFTFTNSTTGCVSQHSASITIDAKEDATITGKNEYCIGESATLSSNRSGGKWTSSDPSVVTISTTGVVTAISPGTVNIIFEHNSGTCLNTTTYIIVVHPKPIINITGASTICQGLSTTLSPTTGGIWTSSNPTVATINNAGVVTGVNPGSATFTFTNISSTCPSDASSPVTVLALPNISYTGPTSLCIDATTTLQPTTGGTWVSSDPTIATINNAGLVTAISHGTVTFRFTSDASGCTSNASGELIVHPKPLPIITGPAEICIGGTTTINPSSGGTWTSESPTIANISNAGLITGISVGSAKFIFTDGITGCVSDQSSSVIVNPLPSAFIDYMGSICLTDNSQLEGMPSAGTPDYTYAWNGPESFVGNTKIVDISNNGSYYLTVTDSKGCSAVTSGFVYERFDPYIVSVQTQVCEGQSMNLNVSAPPGSTYQWSDNAGNSTSQSITVLPELPSSIYYVTVTSSIGCTTVTSADIKVNPKPIINVSGVDAICIGFSTILSPTSGGFWYSSNPLVATITNAGVVTGHAAGSAAFTYTDGTTGCTSESSISIVVHPRPIVTITGSNAICINSTTTLSPSTGGTWISNNPSVATVTNAGIVTGHTAGSAGFIFTNTSTGCTSGAPINITVNPIPPTFLNGNNEVCIGVTTQMMPTSGGTWISNNPSIATITSSGLITGISSGSTTFRFTDNATGCHSYQTEAITVLPKPIVAISGNDHICPTTTTTLSPDFGGSWVSNNPTVATVSNTGIVTGIAPGQATFYFISSSTNCTSDNSLPVTVYARPIVNITGPNSICVNNTTTLSPITGGSWISNNTSIATVNDSGLVTGILGGNTSFRFVETSTGCSSLNTPNVTVYNRPIVSITGSSSICISGTTNLSPIGGGTWVSNNSTVASVSNSGLVTALSIGNATFTFTETSTGCSSNLTTPVAVSSKPGVTIIGRTLLCVGTTTTLSPSSGGTWSSTNPNVATVSNTGEVTAIANGTARFIFTTLDGCTSDPTASIIVNGSPTITPSTDLTICIGETTFFSSNSSGTWSSNNPTIATINNAGIVTGIAPGFANFEFTDDATGCSTSPTEFIHVTGSPTITIIGPMSICIGATTQLTPTVGGIWSSINPSIGTVNNTGLVSGITPGIARFTFVQSSTMCPSTDTLSITVNPNPTVSISGSPSICEGATTTLSPSTGGTWVSLSGTIASVSNSGVVTGLRQGTARFRYTSSSTGCVATTTNSVVVNPRPNISLNGETSICIGGSTAFLPSAGGTWVSSDNNVATINNNGIVTGVNTGVATFTFTDAGTSCSSNESLPIDVNLGDNVSLNGDDMICLGYTTQLSPVSGGFWESTNPAIATVNNSGLVTGHAPGVVSFKFTNAENGCISLLPSDAVKIVNCLDPDFNVTFTNVAVTGNVSTNDDIPTTGLYGFPQLISKPLQSVATISINVDGSYSFTANIPGVYEYRVPVCIPPSYAGCPFSDLVFTVVDRFNNSNVIVANTDFTTSYQMGNNLVGMPVGLRALDNDICLNSNSCTLSSLNMSINQIPTNGNIIIGNDGIVTYTPNVGYVGQESFRYAVCSDQNPSNCALAKQIITTNSMSALNSTVGVDDFISGYEGQAVSGNVLNNDSDPEGDTQTVISQGSESNPITIASGFYYITSDGSFEYTPNTGFFGPVEIVYTVCDDNLDQFCTKATLRVLVLSDVRVNIRVYLEGALMQSGGAKASDNRPLMRDNLRANPFTGQNYIPSQDPYTFNTQFVNVKARYNHHGPGLMAKYQTIENPNAVFGVTGQNAIVDWVFVELRSKSDYTKLLATRSGLLQRDGDVVDLDGVSNLAFPGITADSFYVVVRHRNHLGVMSAKIANSAMVDFTKANTPVFNFGTSLNNGFNYTGLTQRSNVVLGYNCLYAGDFDGNRRIKFTNPNDDQNLLFFDVLAYPENSASSSNFNFAYGYLQGDYDMNGKSKYDNPNDDKNYLFSQLLMYPLNTELLSNFNFMIEQVPLSTSVE